MKGAALFALPLLLLFAGFACGDDEFDLGETIDELRSDSAIQENIAAFHAANEQCVREERAGCLEGFIQGQEQNLVACLDVYDEEGDLCLLNLELVAGEHGWKIPNRERKTPLLRSEEAAGWERDCVDAAGWSVCFARHTLYLEEAFNTCAALWPDECEGVLADLMAGLRGELAARE